MSDRVRKDPPGRLVQKVREEERREVIVIREILWFPKNCVLCADELGTREDELCEECRGNRIRANRAMRPLVDLAREPIPFSQRSEA